MSYDDEIKGLERKNSRIDAEIIDKIVKWVKIAEKIKAGDKAWDFQLLQVAVPEQVRKLTIDNRVEAEVINKIFKEIMKLRSTVQGRPTP